MSDNRFTMTQPVDVDEQKVWDPVSLEWVAMEQPVLEAGSLTVSGTMAISQVTPGTTNNVYVGNSGNIHVFDECSAPFANYISDVFILTTADVAYLVPNPASGFLQGMVYYNESDTVMFFGDSSVTTSTGIPIFPEERVYIHTSNALYIMCSAAGKQVRFLECTR